MAECAGVADADAVVEAWSVAAAVADGTREEDPGAAVIEGALLCVAARGDAERAALALSEDAADSLSAADCEECAKIVAPGEMLPRLVNDTSGVVVPV